MSRERGLCAEWWSDFVLCGVGLGLGLWWRANELVERKYCELNIIERSCGEYTPTEEQVLVTTRPKPEAKCAPIEAITPSRAPAYQRIRRHQQSSNTQIRRCSILNTGQ